MKKTVFIFPGNEQLGERLISQLDADKGAFILRRFPDSETYIRLLTDVRDRDIIVICTLHQPDQKFLPLLFFCNLLKEKKAGSICLVAPYLGYMRQDKEFNTGEAITAVYFAKQLSAIVDQLITIDPHLHRIKNLQEIYSIPCSALHAQEVIAGWIKNNIPHALLIGPDEESEQWVANVSKNTGIPFLILKKTRHGDRNVEVEVPKMKKYNTHIPVLVDDIISSAGTMIETAVNLKKSGFKQPVCIGVHAVFAKEAYENLMRAGVQEIITSNTIHHPTNKIDVSKIISRRLLEI